MRAIIFDRQKTQPHQSGSDAGLKTQGKHFDRWHAAIKEIKRSAFGERAFAKSTSGEGERTVANIEPEVILRLLDEVENLAKTSKLGDRKKEKLLQLSINDLRVAINGGAADFDGGRWSCLGETKQNEFYRRLTGIRQDLADNARLRVSPPANDMLPGDGVSNKSIIWLAIFGFIFAATLVSLVR